MGGAPHRIVSDNATGAGRKIGGKATEAKLLSRMHAHCEFSVTCANPDSGHEKGSVERKAGWSRQHLFTPVPALDGIAAFNAALLERRCSPASAGSASGRLPMSAPARQPATACWDAMPHEREGARPLFQVVSKRCERRSLIVAANPELSRWGSVLTDDQMAAATIDRMIHYGHLIVFEGPTKRMGASPVANKRQGNALRGMPCRT